MKRVILVLLIVSASLESYCQKRVCLKFSPLTLMDDVSFPTIQAGIEYRVSEKFGWYNELGVKYRRSQYDKYGDTTFAPSNGFKVKTELRYYLNSNSSRTYKKGDFFKNSLNPYLAFNFFRTRDDRTNSINYYYHRDSTREQTDVFSVRKKVSGFNFLVGNESSLGRHFGFDMYLGGGIRFRNFKTNHQEYNPNLDYWLKPIDVNAHAIFTEAEIKQKKDATGNFSCGIRVSYKL